MSECGCKLKPTIESDFWLKSCRVQPMYLGTNCSELDEVWGAVQITGFLWVEWGLTISFFIF